MPTCSGCGGSLEKAFRYCPWCASPQRLKLTEFFRAHRGVEGARGTALGGSGDIGDAGDESHVRFSVWNEAGEAEAAVSLDERESGRLASFLHEASVRVWTRSS
jgi:hypothetical protein